jgi:ribosome-interacting GTPase 1
LYRSLSFIKRCKAHITAIGLTFSLKSTLLDKIDEADLANNTGFIFAPGEGQRPISLYNDPDAEYLAFPSIFCGKSRPDNKDRHVPVQYFI